jgi:hypothetical protein
MVKIVKIYNIKRLNWVSIWCSKIGVENVLLTPELDLDGWMDKMKIWFE